MNKKMREIMAKIKEKEALAKKLMGDENRDLEQIEKILNEAEELRKEYEVEKRLFEIEKEENMPENPEFVNKKEDGFQIVSKIISNKGHNLRESEKALLADGENGENFLIPEDVQLAITELRRAYVSAKEIVNVIQTNTLSGTTNWEVDNETAELTQLTADGEEIPNADAPKFAQKSWKIVFYAKLFPISKILLGNEKASLMSYLNRWFLKKAIYTENKKIFEELAKDKTMKTVKGWRELKKLINVDIDPSIRITAHIVTNQTGFAMLDEEEDKIGRGILESNPAKVTLKMFQGLPIKVFSDRQLPNISGKPPMFVGDTTQGVDFIERTRLEFAISEHFLFSRNQTCMRILEGFAVIGTDKEAYHYILFQPTSKESSASV